MIHTAIKWARFAWATGGLKSVARKTNALDKEADEMFAKKQKSDTQKSAINFRHWLQFKGSAGFFEGIGES
jgi:hypothetical protein